MPIKKEILDELINDYKNPEDLLGENGLLKQLTKTLLERAMDGELTHEPGYEKNDNTAPLKHFCFSANDSTFRPVRETVSNQKII